jgi:hypothetical protein
MDTSSAPPAENSSSAPAPDVAEGSTSTTSAPAPAEEIHAVNISPEEMQKNMEVFKHYEGEHPPTKEELQRYGKSYFICFIAAVYSRLAYKTEKDFMDMYLTCFGLIIPGYMLEVLNNRPTIQQLLDSKAIQINILETIIKIKGIPDIDKELSSATYEEDTMELKGTHQVNIADFAEYIDELVDKNKLSDYKFGNIKKHFDPKDFSDTNKFIVQPSNFKFISIATSNYGNVYIVADKRMSNYIWVVFRGTYSAKTAAAYSKPSSIKPFEVCKGEQYLFGMFKILIEIIHTIIEAMRTLATDFLNAKSGGAPIRVLTTGHSLGAAMATDFAYIWTTKIKKMAPYNAAPYDILSTEIGCFSFGSPRPFAKDLAAKFCSLMNTPTYINPIFAEPTDTAFFQKTPITYIRVVSNGDPVTALPPKYGVEFMHPCSGKGNEKEREIVMEDCAATETNLVTPINSYENFNTNLNCVDKTGFFSKLKQILMNHTTYYYINFGTALNIVEFIKGIGTSREVARYKDPTKTYGVSNLFGDTVCRLIIKDNATKTFKAVYFDLKDAQTPNPANKDELTLPASSSSDSTDPAATAAASSTDPAAAAAAPTDPAAAAAALSTDPAAAAAAAASSTDPAAAAAAPTDAAGAVEPTQAATQPTNQSGGGILDFFPTTSRKPSAQKNSSASANSSSASNSSSPVSANAPSETENDSTSAEVIDPQQVKKDTTGDNSEEEPNDLVNDDGTIKPVKEDILIGKDLFEKILARAQPTETADLSWSTDFSNFVKIPENAPPQPNVACLPGEWKENPTTKKGGKKHTNTKKNGWFQPIPSRRRKTKTMPRAKTSGGGSKQKTKLKSKQIRTRTKRFAPPMLPETPEFSLDASLLGSLQRGKKKKSQKKKMFVL